MKKTNLLLLALCLLQLPVGAQSSPDFKVILEEIAIPNLPNLQSYVVAESGGDWLLLGGRKDGLHRRQPFAAFAAAGRNDRVYVLRPATKEVWSRPLTDLAVSLREQLQSTNMEFQQVGNLLYIAGGYGYSPTADQHLTFPNLTVVNVPAAVAAVVSGESLQPHFRQIEDPRVQVTGGYMGFLDDYFYLAGGQHFHGRYNPMGPNHGPGFFQAYTNEIRRFKITDNGTQLALSDYSAWRDTQHLHRRDYNMVPQIFPDGRRGFTMFSGVFRYDANLPWLNTVDVDAQGFQVNPDFEQLLNQYHTAHLAMYDAASNAMHTVFFGGISRFFVDEVTGFLIDDVDVPFVKTISMVTRFSDGKMKELKIGEMPQLLGASAEFLPANTAWFDEGVLRLENLQSDTAWVGYILGGIRSSQPNIFFINTGAESVASDRLYRVSLVRGKSSATPLPTGAFANNFSVKPNPFREEIQISFSLDEAKSLSVQIFDASGQRVLKMPEQKFAPGNHALQASLRWFPAGKYIVNLIERGRVVAALQTFKEP